MRNRGSDHDRFADLTVLSVRMSHRNVPTLRVVKGEFAKRLNLINLNLICTVENQQRVAFGISEPARATAT